MGAASNSAASAASRLQALFGSTPPRMPVTNGGRVPEQRRRQMFALIESQGRVTTEELSARFGTSLVSVRGVGVVVVSPADVHRR